MENTKIKERAAMAQMLCCALLWSTSGVLIKLIPWDAFAILCLRSFLSAPVLFLYMHKGLKDKVIFNKKTLSLGVFVAAIYFCYIPATKLTTSANAIIFQYTAPIYVLLFGALFYKQKIRIGDAIAVLFAIIGITLFFFEGLGQGSLLGNALGLLSGVFLGAMFFMGGGITNTEQVSGILLAQLIAFFISFPLLFTSKINLTPFSVLCIMLLGMVQLGCAYILYTKASRSCPPLTCTLISMSEPLLNPLWVFLIVGEKPGRFALFGGAIVLASITLWYIWNDKQKQKEITANAAS